MSIEYIRKAYGVPAEIGGRIIYTGNDEIEQYGTIVGTTHASLIIQLDGQEHTLPYHPTWQIKYLAHGGANGTR